MKMQVLIVSDCEIVINGIRSSIDSPLIEIHSCLYSKSLDLLQVQPAYVEGFEVVIISLRDLNQASDVSTEAHSMWHGVKLIVVKNSSWKTGESETILRRISWRITRVENPLSDLKDSVATIYSMLFVPIKRDKYTPQIELLSEAELEIIYLLQQPISDMEEMQRISNKSKSQLNNILSSISMKMDIPNTRAGLVASSFRTLGEVRKTTSGAYVAPGMPGTKF